MKKLTISIALLGVGLVGGGVGMLHLQEANYLSTELWRVYGNFLKTSPRGVIEAAQGGPTAGVIRGLLIVTVGGAVVTISSVIPVAAIALRGIGGITGRVASAAKDRIGSSAKRGTKSSKSKQVRIKTFAEKQARLEGGWMEKIRPILAKIAAAVAAKVREVKARRAAARHVSFIAPVVSDIVVDKSFLQDLRAWHDNVRKTAGRDMSAIEDAKQLQQRATPEVLAKVRSEDAMGAELLIRMMTAWAAKTDDVFVAERAPLAPPRDAEATILSHAISDVLAHGVEVSDSEEEGVDFDDDDAFIDNDLFLKATGRAAEQSLEHNPNDDRQAVEDEDESDGSADQQRDKLVDLDEDEDDAPTWSDDAEDEGEEGGLRARMAAALEAAWGLKCRAREVLDGNDEWSEDLEDQADRVAVLEEMFGKIEELSEAAGEGNLTTWIEDGDGQPEWMWFADIASSLNEERKAILETIVDNGLAQDDVAEVDGEDEDEDLNAGFGVPVKRSSQPEENPDHLLGAVPEGVTENAEDEAEGAGDDGVEGDVEAAEDTEDDRTAEDEVEPALADDVPEEGRRDLEPEEAPLPLAFDEDVPAVEADETEPFEGRDLAIGELDEVQMSDEFLGKWGMSAKAAGAFEAKLVNVILGRNGGRRSVIGTVHMTAFFKNDGGELIGQLNIIFRYVPEGDWILDAENSVRMVDRRGNFIGVKDDLLSHLSPAINTTVVHFHGPGVTSDIDAKLKPNLYVSARHWTADEIRRIALS